MMFDDVFDRNPSNRQFYTMPITTVPNEPNNFCKMVE